MTQPLFLHNTFAVGIRTAFSIFPTKIYAPWWDRPRARASPRRSACRFWIMEEPDTRVLKKGQRIFTTKDMKNIICVYFFQTQIRCVPVFSDARGPGATVLP